MLLTYGFQDQVRDLANLLSATVKEQPTLLSLIEVVTDPSQYATNHKHEWMEDKLTPQADNVSGAILVAATALVVDNVGRFAVHDIWVNTSTDERFRVTAVNTGTSTLTITRAVGGVDTAMAVGDELKLVARPQAEGSEAGDDDGQQPSTEYNFTQIFDRTAKVSRSSEGTKKYGIESQINYQVNVHMDQIARELNMSAIYGARVQRTASVRGSMGGILSYLDQAGGNKVDAAGAAVTTTLLNNTLEMAFQNGAGRLAAVCHQTQARKITALDSNYQIVREDRTAGKVIYEYQGDIPGGAQTPAAIVVDPNYSKKRIDFVDMSRLRVVPFANGPLVDFDATQKGADNIARRILGEITMEMKNALEAHASLQNLAA